jgi:filamentous hemagglutinin
MPYTLGFIDADELAEHFDAHITIQGEFAFATEAEYLTEADRFLGEPLDRATTHECIRKCRDGTGGDRLRYNKITQEFGCLSRDNHIRTYFKPDPTIHRKGSNYLYFRWSCSLVLC